MARIALFLIFFTFISIKLCFAGQSCKKLPPSAPIDPKWVLFALKPLKESMNDNINNILLFLVHQSS